MDNDQQSLIRAEVNTVLATKEDCLFSIHEVDRVISNLNDRKAPGPDGISANIIKNIHLSHPTLLREVFNKCLALGVFPDRWKTAVVKIIPKPVSNTTSTSAMMLGYSVTNKTMYVKHIMNDACIRKKVSLMKSSLRVCMYMRCVNCMEMTYYA